MSYYKYKYHNKDVEVQPTSQTANGTRNLASIYCAGYVPVAHCYVAGARQGKGWGVVNSWWKSAGGSMRKIDHC